MDIFCCGARRIIPVVTLGVHIGTTVWSPESPTVSVTATKQIGTRHKFSRGDISAYPVSNFHAPSEFPVVRPHGDRIHAEVDQVVLHPRHNKLSNNVEYDSSSKVGLKSGVNVTAVLRQVYADDAFRTTGCEI